jgi:hypothetical protein
MTDADPALIETAQEFAAEVGDLLARTVADDPPIAAQVAGGRVVVGAFDDDGNTVDIPLTINGQHDSTFGCRSDAVPRSGGSGVDPQRLSAAYAAGSSGVSVVSISSVGGVVRGPWSPRRGSGGRRLASRRGPRQDGADEADDGVVVGEHPDDVGAPLDLLVDPFERVGGPDLAPVRPGEGRVGGDVVLGVGEQLGGLGEVAFERGRRPGAAGRGWPRRRSGRRWCAPARRPSRPGPWARWRAGCASGGPGSAARRALQHPCGWRPSARRARRRSPAAPRQAAVLEVAQELGPEQLVLGVADVDAQDLTVAVGGTPVAITTAGRRPGGSPAP